MMDPRPESIIRSDSTLRAGLEKGVDHFKYLATVSWAPVIFLLPFMTAENTMYGFLTKLVITVCLVALIYAGSIFFLAYSKQNTMLAHFMMGEQAIAQTEEVNPNVREIMATNAVVARRLGHVADRIAFPAMTISYALLASLSVIRVWV